MITVRPSRDIAIFNRLINHPEISPHVRDDSTTGELNIASLNTHSNFFLRVDANDHPVGFVLMLARGAGVYEQHSGLLKAYRGHNALRAGKEVLRWMFLNTDCATVSTWAWSSAKHVMLMARYLGFVEESRSKWPQTVNGQSVDRVIYSMGYTEWSRRAKDDFVEDSLRMNLGVEPAMIGYDVIFARMALARQHEKAQNYYNRVAAIHGAQPVNLIAARADNVIAMIANRICEISSDLSVSVTQPDLLCPSQPHFHT